MLLLTALALLAAVASACGGDERSPITATLAGGEATNVAAADGDAAATTGGPLRYRSSLADALVVAYYGYPEGSLLGILGAAPPEAMALELEAQARAYEQLLPNIRVVPAFHLIAAVAQAEPQPDGSYLTRMDPAHIDEYLRVAREHGFLVILDLQIGRSSVAAEIDVVRRYLAEPDVHLALDPEFTMAPGEVPGQTFGQMDASQINEAQQLLEGIVRASAIPSKMLVVHQFEADMVTNKVLLRDYAGVELVFDADGVGDPGGKLIDYENFVRIDGAEFGAIKLFYKEDVGLLSPGDIVALDPLPALVIYQ